MPPPGSLSLGPRFLWRRLASAPGPAITIVVATLLAVLFVTAVPRVLELVSQADLDDASARAEPEQRNIRSVSQARLATGSHDPLEDIRERGVTVMTEVFPASVQSIVSDVHTVAETPPFRMTSFPDNQPGPFPTSFRFRLQDGIDGEVTLVEGSLPEEQEPLEVLLGNGCPDDRLTVAGFEEDPEVACVLGEAPVFETAITAETSADIGLGVGDRALLHPDPQDRIWFAFGFPDVPPIYVMAVSGIVELSDSEREIWFGDTSLHRPRIVENPDFRLVFAQGLTTPDLYDGILAGMPNAAMRYTWRYLVDPDLLDAARASDLHADLGRITPPPDQDIFTSLPALLAGYLEQRALTVSLLSIATISLLVVATAMIFAVAGMMAERHAAGTLLTRDRGASPGQVSLGAAYTGLVLVVPAALCALVTTGLTMPGTEGLVPGRAAALFAVGAVTAVVLANLPHARGRLQALRGEGGDGDVSRARRVVLEIFVLMAMVGAVALLRRRALADPVTDAPPSVDLLLAVTPALVGLAAGILTLRLMSPIMRLLAWVGSQGRAVVAFVGFRRLTSMPSAARAPILVILVAVTVAVFTSVVRTSIASGQTEHMWQVAGADLRIENRTTGAALPSAVDPDAFGEGRPVAEAAVFPETRVTAGTRSPLVTVLAIDTSAYREVVAGTALDPDLVSSLEGLADRIPVVVSSLWGAQPPAIGSEMSLDMGAVDPQVVVAGVSDRFPSLPSDEPFVVMSLDRLRDARGDLMVPASSLFLRADETQVASLAASIGEPARVVSRYEIGAELSADPLARLTDRGLAAVFYLSTACALVAAVSLFAATASRRRRDLRLLRILGLGSDQAAGVTALELTPPVLIASLFGGLTGAIVALLLAPALDIDSFTGGVVPAEIVIDWWALTLVTTLILIVVAGAVAIFVRVSRSEDEGTLLRVGDD
jgi:putative ABC transport system permease protein